MNKVFSMSRFGLLARKHLIEGYKIHLISLVAFLGGLFLLFYVMHLSTNFSELDLRKKMFLFDLIVIGGGILYVGTSFSSFRSKEDSMSYLLIPATRLEKFIFEYFSRLVLFTVLAPLLYWVVANVELAFASSLHQKLEYTYQSFDHLLRPVLFIQYDTYYTSSLEARIWGLLFVWMIFNIAFLGSITFRKLPLIKTLFCVGVVFLFNAALITVSINVFKVSPKYSGSLNDFGLWLTPTAEGAFLKYLIFIFLIVNLILIPVSYLKLKEKEA